MAGYVRLQLRNVRDTRSATSSAKINDDRLGHIPQPNLLVLCMWLISTAWRLFPHYRLERSPQAGSAIIVGRGHFAIACPSIQLREELLPVRVTGFEFGRPLGGLECARKIARAVAREAEQHLIFGIQPENADFCEE